MIGTASPDAKVGEEMRWSNLPLPEAHIAAIVMGAGMHFLLPPRRLSPGVARHR